MLLDCAGPTAHGPVCVVICFIALQEALLLGYMPHRDDFEDFDKSNEGLVSQIGVKSVEDEDIDVSLKLAHVDMYERLLREVGSWLAMRFWFYSLV